MSINPILRPYMENNTPVDIDVIEDGSQHEDIANIASHQKLIEDATEHLNELSLAQDRLSEINEIQIQNLETVGKDPDAFTPVEGGLQEPLPENDDEVVGVIGDQMYKEQLVVENIAGMLGCIADNYSTGTQKLYKALGVRKSTYSPKDVKTESFKENNKKVKAISIYKSHCEGIADAVKSMGSALWSGIKKLIQAVIDYLKSIFSNRKGLIKRIDINISKFEEIKRNRDKYEINPRCVNGEIIKDGKTLSAACSNLMVLEQNLINAITHASLLNEKFEEILLGKDVEKNVKEVKDLRDMLYFKIHPLTFDKGVNFIDEVPGNIIVGDKVIGVDKIGRLSINPVKNAIIQFENVDSVIARADMIVAMGRNTLKGMLTDSWMYSEKLSNALKLLKNEKELPNIYDLRTSFWVGVEMINGVFRSVISLINGLEYLNNTLQKKS